jgi:hypothetical protein
MEMGKEPSNCEDMNVPAHADCLRQVSDGWESEKSGCVLRCTLSIISLHHGLDCQVWTVSMGSAKFCIWAGGCCYSQQCQNLWSH